MSGAELATLCVYMGIVGPRGLGDNFTEFITGLAYLAPTAALIVRWFQTRKRGLDSLLARSPW